MSLPITLSAFAAFAAVSVFAGWRGALPPNPHKGPRMVPWRWIMVLSATFAIILLFQAVRQLQG